MRTSLTAAVLYSVLVRVIDRRCHFRSAVNGSVVAHCLFHRPINRMWSVRPSQASTSFAKVETRQNARSTSVVAYQETTHSDTDCGRRAFSYCAPKIRNEIPAAIRNAPTVQTFTHRLKTHLFSLMNHP